MTKHASEEAALKGHITPAETKTIESTTEMVCKEALVICSAHVNPIQEDNPKILPIKIRINSLRPKLGRITQKLYDLEPNSEAEKPLNIDLDLYQMENY